MSRCCIYGLLVISKHQEIFSITLVVDLQSLKITIDETWKNLDEKVWIEKYIALLENNFKWKASWMNYTTCIMSCGNKIWVPLIGLTRYDVMLRSHKLITLA